MPHDELELEATPAVSDFSEYQPEIASPEFARFSHCLRQLQDTVAFGGAMPLLFDWLVALVVVDAAGRPISRTAYLNVDFTSYALTDTPMRARGD